jgi:hypothetical protein
VVAAGGVGVVAAGVVVASESSAPESSAPESSVVVSGTTGFSSPLPIIITELELIEHKHNRPKAPIILGSMVYYNQIFLF